MGLFDDLSKKIGQTSQNLISKANEMVDITKLNSQIAEEGNAIKGLLQQLGEKYYEKYDISQDEELGQICTTIKEKEEKIASLRQQVLEAKSIRNCPSCGAACEKDMMFCSACGTELPKSQKQMDKKFCVNCGQQIAADATFCPHCGTKE